MKKLTAVLMAALMLFSFGACAEETESPAKFVTANAVVKSRDVYQITAPYSGVMLPFDWEMGDGVEKGQVLFMMDTGKIYAPADGSITELFVREGDACEDAMGQYGMIASLEKTRGQKIACSVVGAYNDPDNRVIHVGEKVYFSEVEDKGNQGEGRVIAVDEKSYIVELTEGDFDVNDQIKVYRDEKLGAKTCIGSGKVFRDADLAIPGSGRVVRSWVSKGQMVKKGQLLFEVASPDADANHVLSEIKSPVTGTIELTSAQGTQQVYKGQVLAKVHDLGKMQLTAEVDEMDLDKIQVGDTLTVEVDRYPGKKINGTVEKISKIGIAKQNATYYNVTLNVNTNLELLPGMNATVLLPVESN